MRVLEEHRDHDTPTLDESDGRWCGSNYDALGNRRFKALTKQQAKLGDGPIETWFHPGQKQGRDSALWTEDLNFWHWTADLVLSLGRQGSSNDG